MPEITDDQRPPEPNDPLRKGESTNLPDLPPGARILPADEAVELLVTGDHPQAGAGSLALDGALVAALRDGLVVACQLPDGQIAFTRTSAAPQ